VTGLSIYASFDSIYKEMGWETLKVKKPLLFYKIVNKEVPDYLYELVPPSAFNALHLFRILECNTLRKRSPIE
jgi:hypothetical protein